ncbi:MAG: DNA-binding domain-containing protein [Desulfovibrionaceae bacterium]
MTIIKDAYPTAEVAELLGITRQAVQARANRESWRSRPRAGRGGGAEWLVESMPEATRLAIGAAVSAGETAPAVAGTGLDAVVPDWAWRVARARYRLVAEWRAYAAQRKGRGGMREITQAFLLAYASGGLLADVREVVGDVSLPTLYRWDKALREHGQRLEVLADRRGGWANGRKRGLGQIGEEAQHAFLAAYLQDSPPSITLAYDGMKLALERKGLPVPTYTSVRRFIKRFDEYNHDLVVFHREGHKALEDKVGPYLTRDDRILQVGDVLVSDGHRMNFMIYNPDTKHSQRMTLVGWQDWASRMFVSFEIMPEESTQAIASSLFRAIQNLGREPKAVYIDNGKAFKNKYFSGSADMAEHDGLYFRLGIHVQHSMPYVARTKVVERWWGDFDRECSRLMPGYVGPDIDHKPAHLKRNETWHRERNQESPLTLEQAKQVVAAFALWKGQQPHPTRPGTTPLEMFNAGRGPGFDPDGLAELSRHFLYRRPVTPRRCRIEMLGLEFESDALYGINKELTACYSFGDLSEIWLYDGEHCLGTAKPVTTVHPMAATLGTQFNLQQLKTRQKAHSKLVRGTVQLASQMAPAAAEVLYQLPHMRPVAERRTTLQPKATAPALAAGPAPAEPELSAAERAKLEAARRRALATAEARPAYEPREVFASPLERYAYLFDVEVARGLTLTAEDAAWARKYERTDEYREAAAPRFEALRRVYRKTA